MRTDKNELSSIELKCPVGIGSLMTEQWPAGAAKAPCVFSALNAAAGKSERSTSAQVLNVRCIPIDRAPESHRKRLRTSQMNRNQRESVTRGNLDYETGGCEFAVEVRREGI
jgi:hypothetical protein